MVIYDIRTGIKKVKTKTALTITGAAVGTAGLVAALALPLAARAVDSTVVVTPATAAAQGWDSSQSTLGGTVSYVNDSTSPAPNGALQLTTDNTNTAKAEYYHAANVALSDVTELSYYTKQVSASFSGGDPSYQLLVNLNGTSGFATLVYEPYWQNNGNPDNAPVVSGQWQQWSNIADNGLFWSSQNVTCSDGSIVKGAGGPPFYTLADITTSCPSAQVVGFGTGEGSYNPNYVTEVDLLDFNGTTYDFQQTNVPTDKDACKNGGWTSLTDSSGNLFTNQGDCVSFVATGGKNLANTH